MDKNSPVRKLLLEIVKCPNFGGNSTNCKPIFDTQSRNIDKWLPVPWQGHLEEARILFISSNPSPLSNGFLASQSWVDKNKIEKILDFYEGRFEDRLFKENEWTRKHIHYRALPEQASVFNEPKYWVRYWASTKKRAAIMLEKYLKEQAMKEVIPGKDYAITEIVHCYSNDEDGVEEAKKECSGKYLENIIRIAKQAKVLALTGDHSVGFFNGNYDMRLKVGAGFLNKDVSLTVPEKFFLGRNRLFVALPAPNKRGKRKISDCLTHEEILRIQNYLL